MPEFCPSCGEEVQELEEETGWCATCSGSSDATCVSCLSKFTKDQPHRKLCPTCRDERWLANNAEAIENLMLAGATITKAKREVYHSNPNSPRCISCGRIIKGAANGASFCTRTKECRSWRRRYRTLRERFQSKGIVQAKKQALAQVSAEIFIMQD